MVWSLDECSTNRPVARRVMSRWGIMSRMIHVLALAAGLAVGGGTVRASEPDASSPTVFELRSAAVAVRLVREVPRRDQEHGGLRLDSREAIWRAATTARS